MVRGAPSKRTFSTSLTGTGTITPPASPAIASLPRVPRVQADGEEILADFCWDLLSYFSKPFCFGQAFLTGGAVWQSPTWAPAMFSKRSSVYCADGFSDRRGFRSRHWQLFKCSYSSPSGGQLDHQAAVPLSEL